MRPIKFLGKRTDRDEFVIGEAVGLGGNSIGCWVSSYGNWELRWYPVEPESIAQFVGRDKDGREVYEGDTLVDADGNKHVARLESVTQNPDTAEFHLWTCPSKLKLTEAQS